jgi:hypothetical protein
MLQITNNDGRKFNVRVVMVGDSYGRDHALTHTAALGDMPMIEFYDATYTHTEYGQFVSRYYHETLANRTDRRQRLGLSPKSGLCLDGGTPAWQISEANLREAIAYAKGVIDART